MKLMLFRHGLTAGNLERRYIGITDQPLCPKGREALLRQPHWERITDVWITPLRRTAQTAAILFPHAKQWVCPGLSEMDFGTFENKSWRALSTDADYQRWLDSGCEEPCPSGESRAQFTRRCCDAFEALIECALGKGHDLLCIVAHGGTMMALLSVYATPREGYFSYQTPCGGHWVLEIDETQWAWRKTLTILRRPQGEKEWKS